MKYADKNTFLLYMYTFFNSFYSESEKKHILLMLDTGSLLLTSHSEGIKTRSMFFLSLVLKENNVYPHKIN